MTIVADSAGSTDVQTAIDAASDGDIISIPSDSATWEATVEIPDTKGISLIGAGIGNTNINLSTYQLYVETAPSGNSPVRISGMSLTEGQGADSAAIQIHNGTAGAKNWRIDHCSITYANSRPAAGIRVKGYTWGVIDNCLITNPGRAIYVTMPAGVLDPLYDGDYSWTQPITIGGPDAVYVEDCVFENDWDNTAQATECGRGGRLVFRHNTVRKEYAIETHSGCTNGMRNPRWVEIYENTCDVEDEVHWDAIWLRGCNGIVYNNTCLGHSIAILVDYEMSCRTNCNGGWGNPEDTYPGQDQIGVGMDTGWGTAQATDEAKLWVWDNTLDGAPAIPTKNSWCDATTEMIQEDRDYFLSAKSGYTPYTYPHPLRDERPDGVRFGDLVSVASGSGLYFFGTPTDGVKLGDSIWASGLNSFGPSNDQAKIGDSPSGSVSFKLRPSHMAKMHF